MLPLLFTSSTHVLCFMFVVLPFVVDSPPPVLFISLAIECYHSSTVLPGYEDRWRVHLPRVLSDPPHVKV